MLFDFDEKLRFSDSVAIQEATRQILLKRFPSAINVTRATHEQDLHGIDFWAILKSGKRFSIDLKAREEDPAMYNSDDVCLELWSVLNRKIGWSLDPSKLCDYILFLWQDSQRSMLVPFPALVAAFQKHRQEWIDRHNRKDKTHKPRIQISQRKDGSTWEAHSIFVDRCHLAFAVTTELFGPFSTAPPESIFKPITRADLLKAKREGKIVGDFLGNSDLLETEPLIVDPAKNLVLPPPTVISAPRQARQMSLF